MQTISWQDFEMVELRVGTLVRVEPFPEARRPAYKVWADFGPELGVRKSSAQITDLYRPEDLVGRQIVAVVNFPPKQIGQTCNGTVFFQISLQQRPTLLLATLFHRRQEAELGTEDVCFLPHPLHQFRHRTEVHLLYPHGCRTYLLPVCHLTRGQGKRKRTQAVQPHIFSLPQMGYNHIGHLL
jgi:export-related chaperone CsaA